MAVAVGVASTTLTGTMFTVLRDVIDAPVIAVAR